MLLVEIVYSFCVVQYNIMRYHHVVAMCTILLCLVNGNSLGPTKAGLSLPRRLNPSQIADLAKCYPVVAFSAKNLGQANECLKNYRHVPNSSPHHPSSLP